MFPWWHVIPSLHISIDALLVIPNLFNFKLENIALYRLDPVELNDEPGVLLTTVNLEFPNEIRHERREERIDLSGLSIIKKHS